MRLCCGATLAAIAVLAPVAAADHGGPPTAGDVATGKARVAALERQVRAAAAEVDRAQAALDRLRTQAEVAVEAYDHAVVAQAAAAQNLDAARLVLTAADAQVRHARDGVDRFAVAAYEGGAGSMVAALLSAQRPDAMLYRLATLGAVSRSQRDVLQGVSAATVYQRVVAREAATALRSARAAAAAAGTARLRAQLLVAVQSSAVTRLTAAQQRLSTMLAQARLHADALVRARLQAIAAARAAATRAAAQRTERLTAASPGPSAPAGPAAGGGTGSTAGTVSAATERAALGYAEAQIGKPYQWGAAGPDSYDCSGLVMWSYAQVGVHVDHWTGYQWNEGAHIPLSALRPGDLLFFATDTSNPDTIHHVGIYAGGTQMVEAPYTGANVRMSAAFRPDLIGAVRLYAR